MTTQAAGPAASLTSRLVALCSGADGRVSIVVLDTVEMKMIDRIDLPWNDFRPASAGHRLIEHGWQIQQPAFFQPGNTAGWQKTVRGMPLFAAPVDRINTRPVPAPEFICPRCGRPSWNPEDAANGWCGKCEDWTGLMDPVGSGS